MCVCVPCNKWVQATLHSLVSGHRGYALLEQVPDKRGAVVFLSQPCGPQGLITRNPFQLCVQ